MMTNKLNPVFFLFIGLSILLSSCNPYQKLLKSNDLDLKLEKSKEFYKAAIIEYQRAINEYQGFSPIFINKLAKTRFITKEFNEAETILRKSLN